MIDLKKHGKRVAIVAGAAFIAFHVIVLGGALGYGAHLVGLDVPFLDHSHDDCRHGG